LTGWLKDRDSPVTVETIANGDLAADERTALVISTTEAVENPEYFQANKTTPLLLIGREQ